MKKNEVLNLMYELAHKTGVLVKLDEEDVRYLSNESEVTVLSSYSQEEKEKRIDCIIRDFEMRKEELEHYQRYILWVEYNPKVEFMMDELVRLSTSLKEIVDISKWSLCMDDTINGIKVSLVMSR